MIKKALLSLLALVGVLFFILAILISTLIFRPNLIINKPTAQKLQAYFAPDVAIDWQHLNFDIQRKAHGIYLFSFAGDQLCQDLKIYGRACFDELRFSLEIETNYWRITRLSFPFIRIKDREVSIKIPQTKESASEAKNEDGLDLKNIKQQIETALSYLKKIHISRFDIDINNTSLFLDPDPLKFFLNAQESAEFKVIKKNWDLDLNGVVKKEFEDILVISALKSHHGDATARMDIKPSKKLSTLSVDIHFISKSKALKDIFKDIRSNMNVTLSDVKLGIFLDDFLLNFNLDPLKTLHIQNCESVVDLELKNNIPLHCPEINISFAPPTSDHEILKKEIRDLPQSLHFKFGALLPPSWIKQNPQESDDPLRLSAEATPIVHPLFRFEFSAKTDLQYRDAAWRPVDPSLIFKIEIPKFENLVRRLKDGRFAVPAPFHVLTGNIKAEVKEAPKSADNLLTLPFILESNLTSKRNAVVALAEGLFSYDLRSPKAAPHLKLDVLIENILFQAPPFDPMRGLPVLAPDGRISKELKPSAPVAKSQEPPVHIDLSIKSSHPDSIQIFHNLILPSIGFQVSVEQDHSETAFKVELGPPSDITYLNRTVTLQNLKLSKEKKQDLILVDGQLLYKAAEYDIFIRVSGPLEKPEVVLSSDPPLNRSDIISVLLYNRLSSNIASFEQESVGGAQAALADRAVGLFGIWAFASTPIEAVSYNPVSRTYSAQIKLPEGFRFSVGTDWESVQNLELRRHLTANWVVMTTYRPRSDEGRDSGEMMLQRRISY